MSFRGALLAGIIVLTATGSGTAEFTTPSLDQWGDGVKRIGPRKHLAAGSQASAAWVAPSSIALVSGAPVALHTLSPDTTTIIAAGEELTLRWAYTRPATPDHVYYYGSTPVAYETSGGMAMPRAAVTPSGAVVTAPGAVVTAPYGGGTYVREIEVPGQRTVDVLVDEGYWVTLPPATVSIIREGTYTETVVTPSGVIVR